MKISAFLLITGARVTIIDRGKLCRERKQAVYEIIGNDLARLPDSSDVLSQTRPAMGDPE